MRRQAELDHRVDADVLLAEGQEDLVGAGEGHPLVPLAGAVDRQVVRPHDDVPGRAEDRAAVGRAEDVVRRHHQRRRLDLRLDRERQVHRHPVAVEVDPEGAADERVDDDRIPPTSTGSNAWMPMRCVSVPPVPWTLPSPRSKPRSPSRPGHGAARRFPGAHGGRRSARRPASRCRLPRGRRRLGQLDREGLIASPRGTRSTSPGG